MPGFGKKIAYAALSLLVISVVGLSLADVINPSAAYCNALGYTYVNEKTKAGDIGICGFPDGSSCSAWNFTEGKCGQKYSYCTLHGYGIKTKSNDWRNYSVCVLSNGSEVEVTKLMGLVIITDKCGDGACMPGENNRNCPEDCPSGLRDGFCDGKADGRCDPDCSESQDMDCLKEKTKTTTRQPAPETGQQNIVLPAALIMLLLVAGYIISKRKKK
jgi:LPXTG-motif cell wall-anchored protein